MISHRPYINVDVSKQQTTQQTQPIINNNININSQPDSLETIKPNGIQQNDNTDMYIQYSNLLRECNALRLILKINKANPLIINEYIIATETDLADLIKILCNADSVDIATEPVISGCITKTSYKKIITIYVYKNNNSFNFKYSDECNNAVQVLANECISMKFCS